MTDIAFTAWPFEFSQQDFLKLKIKNTETLIYYKIVFYYNI